MPRDFAARLASGERIGEPVAIVVAHPDDESLWLGTALRRLENATLVHLTDGAPDDMGDAARLGFATRTDYAAVRAAELDAALFAMGVEPRRIGYGFTDQSLAWRLPELIDRLRADLAVADAVVTHPYEGGHPDHDAAALAVSAASGGPVIEFACYPTIQGERAFGRFWADPDCPERVRPLLPSERRDVDAAIACHRSQSGVIGGWRPVAERWRMAPRYDFTRPPPPGEALYDDFGWALTSGKWRALAAEALALC